VLSIAVELPCGDFLAERVFVSDAAIEALLTCH
jgi:hypothetical protein